MPRSPTLAELTANTLLACAAVALPVLVTLNIPPSATFLNQAVAVVGWGAWLLLLTRWVTHWRLDGGTAVLVGALGIVAAAAAFSWTRHLPGPLAASSIVMLLAAALVAAVGAMLARSGRAEDAFRGLCVALVAGGLLSVAVGVVQMFFPGGAVEGLIAATSIEGRAVGNLRQPNHLSSLLLWSLVALAWLGDRRALRPATVAVFAAALVFGIVASASRTGLLGIFLPVLWAVLDRQLSRRTRLVLLLAPLAYALFWWGLTFWAHETQQVFGGEKRFSGEGDISSSRLGIWRDTLALIAAHPLAGVGFGEFNFAWSLMDSPRRPVAFFDHTHNLPLQLVVELGLPLGLLVVAGLAVAVLRAFGNAIRSPEGDHGVVRAALVMVLMMVVHSQLEYPLWYAYFLLPTALALGLCLGARATAADPAPAAAPPRWPLQACATLLLAGGLLAVVDYLRVASIFDAEDAVPLAERIERGKRSWFFAHHAHYAAATIVERPSTQMPSFDVATHYLLDTRIMMAWAQALAERGDLERARHIAQRLREFRNPASAEFFAACEGSPEPLPFQCTPPSQRFDHRDFF